MKSPRLIRQFVPSLLTLALVFAAPHMLFSQAKTPDPKEQSCKAFTQKFYDIYAAIANTDTDTAPSAVLLRQKPELFGKKLGDLLKSDADAQRKAVGELVGLDFDPFYNSQDPSPNFRVISAKVTDTQCRALVRGVDHGKMRETVMPQLQASGNSWILINFFYNNDPSDTNSNLIDVLKALKADREKEKSK